MTAQIVPHAWMDDASCGHMRAFWESLDESDQVAVCENCPVKQECQSYADGWESRGISNMFDVFGGETPRQRYDRRKRRMLKLKQQREPRNPNNIVCDLHGEIRPFTNIRGRRECPVCREARKEFIRNGGDARRAQATRNPGVCKVHGEHDDFVIHHGYLRCRACNRETQRKRYQRRKQQRQQQGQSVDDGEEEA